MALTITLLGGTPTWTTASGAKTVTATPGVGDLIVLMCAHTNNTTIAAPTDNNSGGAGSYVLVASSTKSAGVATLSVWVRTALVTVNASTVFTHSPGTSTGGGFAVMKVAGALKWGLGAVVQSATQDNATAASTPTVGLPAAALTTNALIGAVFNGDNPATMTPRASPAWTERCDVGYLTPPAGLEVMSIDSGETASSIAWGSTSATDYCAAVIELSADAQVVPAMATARGIGRGR